MSFIGISFGSLVESQLSLLLSMVYFMGAERKGQVLFQFNWKYYQLGLNQTYVIEEGTNLYLFYE